MYRQILELMLQEAHEQGFRGDSLEWLLPKEVMTSLVMELVDLSQTIPLLSSPLIFGKPKLMGIEIGFDHHTRIELRVKPTHHEIPSYDPVTRKQIGFRGGWFSRLIVRSLPPFEDFTTVRGEIVIPASLLTQWTEGMK